MYIRNREKRYKYPTVSRRAVSKRITLETLSEELRVLYVALTRAKHKLIMVSTVKDADKEFEKFWTAGEYPAAPTFLEGIRSYSGWLMTTMLTRPESVNVYKPSEIMYASVSGSPWDIRRVAYKPYEAEKTVLEENSIIEKDDNIIAQIKENLSFEYAYKDSTELPSKLTATELKGRVLDSEISDGTVITKQRPRKFKRPDFTLRDKPLTGSDKGTALHYVMQYIDYSKCGDAGGVSSELERLVEKAFITRKKFYNYVQ